MAAGSRPSSGGLPLVVAPLLGGLLSSSCCLLQLALNAASMGCAGFSVLTPYSPYFRAATGGLLALLLARRGLNRSTLATAALSVLLMVSQDVLAAHNRGALSGSQLASLLAAARARLSAQQAALHQAAAPAPAARRVTLRVRGMRCEGCAARLRGQLAALEGVDACTVHFAAGTAEVWSNSSNSSSGSSGSSGSSAVTADALLRAVAATDSTYVAEVAAAECFDASDRPQPCPPDSSGSDGSSNSSSAQQEL